jgi:hypothetical protein
VRTQAVPWNHIGESVREPVPEVSMPVERTSGSACLIDLFDRMHEKGLVIESSSDDRVGDERDAAFDDCPTEDPASASHGQPDLTRVRLRVVTAAVRTYLDPQERTRSVGQLAKSETRGGNISRSRTKG